MARRRLLDGETDPDTGETIFGVDGGGFDQSFGGGEVSGTLDPETFFERLAAEVPGDVASGGREEGNTERPRDVFPDNEPRQPFVPEPPPQAMPEAPQMFAPEPEQAPAPSYAPTPEPAPAPLFSAPNAPSMAPPAATEPGGIDLSLLPASVEAPAPSQTAEAAPQSTAMAPMTPTPVSTQGQPPASPSTVAPSTPARQPFASPSAIFSAQGPRSVGGRGTGLTGGGLSMPGGPSGAPKPTEEMLNLLRSLGISG